MKPLTAHDTHDILPSHSSPHTPYSTPRILLPALAMAVLLIPIPARSETLAAPHFETIRPPSSSDLLESGPRQRRWLSLPGSRLVLNPYNYTSTALPVVQSASPQLPLHAAYYCGGQAADYRNLVMFYQSTGNPPAPIQTGWQEDFDPTDSGWSSSPNGRINFDDGQFRFAAHGPIPNECDSCALIEQRIDIDLDKFPWLQITVPECAGRWALKVNDGSTTRDNGLQRDTSTTGTFIYNVAELTGWRGQKRFDVKFFAVGLDQPVTVSSFRFAGSPSPLLRKGESVRTTWTPHEVTATTDFPEGTVVESRDFFSDPDTIVRTFDLEQSESPGSTFTLVGQYDGALSWDAPRRVLTVESTSSTCAIAFASSAPLGRLTFYPSQLELLAGKAASTPPRAGLWSVDLSLVRPDRSRLACSIGFSTAQEGSEAAVRRALRPLESGEGEISSRKQQAFWDGLLRTVPRPRNFSLHGIATKGVTSEDVRKAYYAAWVFLAANSLPVLPESGFPYPQLPTGKPSLWFEGHPLASASASWESFFAMQFMGLLEPELAWEAYKGLMSLVDRDGRLGGESLPSRKAETALVLFNQTSDTASLREIYPALRRHLLWARENPRWIHGPHNFADEKDADFVVSLLADLVSMRRIASILDRPDEETFWKTQRETLFAEYGKWFWEKPDGTAYQTFFTETGRRRRGNSLWVASGLVLDQVPSGAPREEGLLRRFRDDYDPARPLAGMGIPKHPEINFLVRGLLDRGYGQEASVVANSAVRDVTRSNMFAEQYLTDDFPHPDGVRPSVFGAAMLIDMIWLKNGTRYDAGVPAPAQLPGEPPGKVTNWTGVL